MFNNYNSMTFLLNNKKNFNQNSKNKGRNKNFQENFEKNNNYISYNLKDEEYNKDFFYKNNSMKLKKHHALLYNVSNLKNKHKKSDKGMEMINKYYNLNDEVKVFENHLKDIRKRSLESNARVKNLLSKRRNSTNLQNYKTFFNKKSNNININKKRKKENYNTINNKYKSKEKLLKKEDIIDSYNNYNNINTQKKNIRIFYWKNKNFN